MTSRKMPINRDNTKIYPISIDSSTATKNKICEHLFYLTNENEI